MVEFHIDDITKDKLKILVLSILYCFQGSEVIVVA